MSTREDLGRLARDTYYQHVDSGSAPVPSAWPGRARDAWAAAAEAVAAHVREECAALADTAEQARRVLYERDHANLGACHALEELAAAIRGGQPAGPAALHLSLPEGTTFSAEELARLRAVAEAALYAVDTVIHQGQLQAVEDLRAALKAGGR